MPKLNLEFYKEDIDYDSSITKQEEKEIIEYINKYTESEYEKIFDIDTRVPVFVNLSDIRNNIINWYPFKENASVLEIGASFGSVTGELCKKCKSVTAIEFIKNRAEAIYNRHQDKDNLEVICGKLEDISLAGKYDYITLFGIAEYADIICGGLSKLIQYAKGLLNDGGIILLAIDNKFGVKYFAGSTNGVNDMPYLNMTGNYINGYKTFGKYELENILKNNQITNYKFYYPLPDYKLANVIYSDDYLPDKNDSKITYNIYYNENENIVFSELSLVKELIKNNEFRNFTNSFLVEINNNENNNMFIGFNNMRKDEYRLITKLTKKEAIKEPFNNKSINQISNISKNISVLKELGFKTIESSNDNEIRSTFMNCPTLDKQLIKTLESNGLDAFLNSMDAWYEYIKSKFTHVNKENNIFEKHNVEVSEELIDGMTLIKEGYIDLVFQNVFVQDNEYIVFDQEWYEENIPLEFVLYRSLNNLFYHNRFIEKTIKKEDIYKHYDILKYIEVFSALEEKWQHSLANNNIIKFYSSTYSRINTLKEITLNYQKLLQKKDECINEITVRNYELEEKNKELNEKLNSILNSRSWRYTKILRGNSKE